MYGINIVPIFLTLLINYIDNLTTNSMVTSTTSISLNINNILVCIILKDALKFTLHGKRKKFFCQDFDGAVKQKGMEVCKRHFFIQACFKDP